MHRVTPLLLALAACGGKPTMKLDVETVEAQLTWMGETVPGCDSTDTADALAAARSAHAAVLAVGPLTLHAGTIARTQGPVSAYAGVGATGGCGGEVTVTSEHENGVTDYVVTFDAFCVPSVDGDLVHDGVILASEKGTPSDSGPIIKAVEVETDGPITVTLGAETYSVTVDKVRADYGYPETWAPGIADDAHPDVVTIGHVELVGGDKTAFIDDLTYERTGTLFDTQITITGGTTGTDEDGRVGVTTVDGEPLGLDFNGGQLVLGGALELTGKGGTSAVVRAIPGSGGIIQVEVDGATVGTALDCQGTLPPLLTLMSAMINALPVY